MRGLSAAKRGLPAVMSALIFDETLRLQDLPIPIPAADEVLVRVRLAGICGTDLEITRGYKHFHGVLGHEFVGEIVSAPHSQLLGKRVCAEINIGCGRCDFCLSGVRAHCRERTVVGILNRPGAFAEYLAVPVRNLHTVPDEVDDRAAVFVEPLAAAFEILEQVPVLASQRVAVLGDGRLGALCAQVVATSGADVTVFGKHEAKLARIAAFGMQIARSADRASHHFDVVIEATGTPDGLRAALALVRPRGILLLKSTYAAPVTVDLSTIPVHEITVIGSRCGPFPRAIEALCQRVIHVEELIDACYPLNEAMAAMRHAADRDTFKILLSAV